MSGLTEALDGLAARGRVLVALDFDGVLSPIVEDPAAAAPLPEAADALAALVAAGVDVALVSGRDIDDLRARAQPPAGVVLVGGHGTQSSLGTAPLELSVAEAALHARLREAVEAIVAAHPGTHAERKPMSVVLHTRRAARDVAAAATAAALEGPGTWTGVHPLAGKEVVELGAVALGKGSGLRRLREQLSADVPVEAVLYAGDDVTDEDAFAALDPAAGDVRIKVGEGATLAEHRVDGPPEVAALLSALARSRAAGRG
ncbi:trehalose-phosphatase [Kineococcus gynurae]|uniref:Trehalose 6-phosphate phosphatase n=1 Tax=Kineococcus gynurae TaxID=452979 RepID=A0ABV5LPH5_9ACTN